MCDIVNIIAVIFLLHSLIKKNSYSPIPVSKQQRQTVVHVSRCGSKWKYHNTIAKIYKFNYSSQNISNEAHSSYKYKKWIDCQIRRIIEHAFLIKIQYNFLYIFYSYNYLSPIFLFLYSVNVSFINGIYLTFLWLFWIHWTIDKEKKIKVQCRINRICILINSIAFDI